MLDELSAAGAANLRRHRETLDRFSHVL